MCLNFVINIGTGVWEPSPKAMQKLAELRGQIPMFIRFHAWNGAEIQPEYIQEQYTWIAYDKKTLEKIDDCMYNREDENLIKAIEELGEQANWEDCKFKIVEIPDTTAKYKIIEQGAYGVGPEEIKIYAKMDNDNIAINNRKKPQPTTQELLMQLASLAKRNHYYCDDTWYSCPLATDGCADDRQSKNECNCGASAHNEKVDALLAQLLKKF